MIRDPSLDQQYAVVHLIGINIAGNRPRFEVGPDLALWKVRSTHLDIPF